MVAARCRTTGGEFRWEFTRPRRFRRSKSSSPSWAPAESSNTTPIAPTAHRRTAWRGCIGRERALGMVRGRSLAARARSITWNSSAGKKAVRFEGDRQEHQDRHQGDVQAGHPDFPDVDFKYDILQKHMRELAYLNEGLQIIIEDERTESARNSSSNKD